jgi:pimeloyl-ACP methyl ester carboxylesterase
MTSHTFTASDGLKLAYYVDDFSDPWREADTVLLLHSAMGSSKRFYGMVPALARRFRVVRLDLRGHGQSQVPPAEPALTMDRLVKDVLDLLAHLGLASVHIVGNSAGGYVGQRLAIEHSDKVKCLALFGSTAGLKRSQARDWLPRVAREGLRGFLAATIHERLTGDQPGLIDWFLDEASRNDTAYIGRFIGLMTTLDWYDELGGIKCPTLIVYPGAESVGSTDNYDLMRKAIPDVEVKVYEGLPHNICDMVPDRCAADVLEFIERRLSAAGA